MSTDETAYIFFVAFGGGQRCRMTQLKYLEPGLAKACQEEWRAAEKAERRLFTPFITFYQKRMDEISQNA